MLRVPLVAAIVGWFDLDLVSALPAGDVREAPARGTRAVQGARHAPANPESSVSAL